LADMVLDLRSEVKCRRMRLRVAMVKAGGNDVSSFLQTSHTGNLVFAHHSVDGRYERASPSPDTTLLWA
jgi:hypothetical protein